MPPQRLDRCPGTALPVPSSRPEWTSASAALARPPTRAWSTTRCGSAGFWLPSADSTKFTERGEPVFGVNAGPPSGRGAAAPAHCARLSGSASGRATNRDPPAFTQADSSTTRKHGEPDWAAHPRQLVILMNRRIGNALHRRNRDARRPGPHGLRAAQTRRIRTRRLEFAGDRGTARTPVGATPAKRWDVTASPSACSPDGSRRRRRPRLRPPICCHIASRRSTLSLASATAVSGRSSRNVRELWS